MSRTPYPGVWIQSMNPMTSRTARGSLSPDSPSSVRATLRRSVEPRSRAKIAAPSVAATIDPSNSPSSSERSKIHQAASPAIMAVRSVPTNASDSAEPSTERISPKLAVRPPSNRISASATIPIVRASS